MWSKRFARLWIVIGLGLLTPGCGPSPVALYNDHLIDAVQGAISAQNRASIESCANRARACHRIGQLTDEQYGGLEAAFERARHGDWNAAATEIGQLRPPH